MENYISKNMYRRKIDVTCCSANGSYSGVVEQIIDGVLVLESDGNKVYIALDKIISFKELD